MGQSKKVEEDEFTEWVRETRRPILVKLADWLQQWNAGHIATLLAFSGLAVLIVGGIVAAIQAPIPAWARIVVTGIGLLLSAAAFSMYHN